MSSQPIDFWTRFWRRMVAHPVACALFLLVASLVAACGLPRLAMDTGFEALMARGVSERQTYIEITREFGSDSRSFLYLRDDKLWTPAKLAALERLHDELQQLPFVERVDDLFSFTSIRSIDGELGAQPLLAHAPVDEQGAESARAAALDNPMAVRNLVGADGKSLAIGIAIREAAQADGDAVYGALEQVVARARNDFPSLLQIGPQRIQAELKLGAMRDLALLGPLSALVLAAIFLGITRNPVRAAVVLAAAAVSLLWTAGLMGFLDIPLNILSVLLPPLVVALGCIGMLRQGQARQFGAPPTLAAFALALGLIGQGLAGIEIVRDFAYALAFAAFANWLATILLLALLSARLGPEASALRRAAPPAFLRGLSGPIASLLHSRVLLWSLALIALAGAAVPLLAPAMRVTHDPLAFFRAGSPVLQAADRMHAELAGVNVLYITLDAHAEGAFRDPANVQRLAEIQAFIAKQRIFDRSFSLADVLAQANREAAGGRSEAYEVPPTRKLLGQYLVLHRPQDLEPYVSHDFRRANIVVRHNERDSSTLNRNIRELQSAVAHYAGPSMTTGVVGQGVLVNAAAERLHKVEDVAAAVVLALVLIGMALMFTSARGGIVAVTLSAIPVLAIWGAMRLFDIPMSAGTMMAVLVAVALTVEGTSRLFSRYCDLSRNAASYDNAAAEALKHEAAPLAAISLTVLAGSGVLLLSRLEPVFEFGLLSCAAALLACLVNLVVAPLALSRIRLVGLYELLAISEQREALEGCPLFAGLNNYEIRKTILISELHEYGKGERLIEQGSMERSMYLIVSGQAEVVRSSGAGEQHIATLNPGDVFGEIGYVHPTYRTADVRALGAVAVLRFDHERLKRDLLLFPHIMAKLNFNISGILGKRLAELVETTQTVSTPVSAQGSEAATRIPG